MKDNLRSRPLMEGSILTAIVFIFMMLSNTPGLYVLGTLLVPIPVAILYIKHKWKMSVLSVLVSTILVSLMLGPVIGFGSGISTAFIGIPLGIGIRSKKSGTRTLIYTFIGCFVSIVINMFLTVYVVMGVTLNSFLNTLVIQYRDASNEILNITNTPQVKESIDKMLSFMTVENLTFLLPIGMALVSFILSICIFIVISKVLVRLRMEVVPLKSFTKWYIDLRVIAIFVVFALIGIEVEKNSLSYGNDIFVWSIGILVLIFVLQALSVIAHLLKNVLKVSNVVTVVVITMLIVSGFVIYIAPIGFIDVILDYRSLDEYSLGSIIRKKISPKE